MKDSTDDTVVKYINALRYYDDARVHLIELQKSIDLLANDVQNLFEIIQLSSAAQYGPELVKYGDDLYVVMRINNQVTIKKVQNTLDFHIKPRNGL